MGFLSGITEKVFGGTDNSAQKAQQAANAKSQQFIMQQAAQARGDAGALFAGGDYARNSGLNAAMALMGQSAPLEMGMFQGGNVAAQNMYLTGLPQFQNAILGMPVNNQALQPYQQTLPDPSSYRMQLPNFGQMQAPQDAQGSYQFMQPGQQPQQPQVNQAILAHMLQGGRF